VIFLTGGTGFVGSYIVSHLVDSGFDVKILTRAQNLSSPLFNHPKIEIVTGDILDKSILEKSIQGCKVILNCVGIILETKKQTFQKMHVDAVKNLVDAAKSCKSIEKIIQISALGTSQKPSSKYFRTKYEGEELIRSSGIKYTIFRPSLIFGKGDKFFPVLKNLVKLPITPVIGQGKNRFQPVYVQDLAKCVSASLTEKETDNKILEIGGPEDYSFINILEIVGEVLNKKCFRIHIPVTVVKAFAMIFEIFLSNPPVTKDQLKMLKVDNITSENAGKELFKLDLMDLKTGLASYLK